VVDRGAVDPEALDPEAVADFSDGAEDGESSAGVGDSVPAAERRPAKVLEETARPSRPITTGECDLDSWDVAEDDDESNVTDGMSVPDTTGTARRAITTVPTMAPSARRLLRCARARRVSRTQRVSAPRNRAERGGPA
jgi:hypothetical protein